jgi:hypothetical protein
MGDMSIFWPLLLLLLIRAQNLNGQTHSGFKDSEFERFESVSRSAIWQQYMSHIIAISEHKRIKLTLGLEKIAKFC